ncbi:AAA family ATPase [Streptomyces sp. NPDC047097]|uniref:nSTAND1 domain-containing NTPase n=1 Tax=Streptomyces sp. NPDC047097 TaxID=3155260 RepID=UPI0033DCA62D
MARHERPLDEGDGPELRFAASLRELRREAGSPTYRVLAQRAHYSIATLSSAAAGRALPSLSVTLAYVRACGGDVSQWERWWHEAAAQIAADTAHVGTETAGGDHDATAPYPGLSAFQPDDAKRFFGREELTGELADRLSRRRFVAVFGASGSGKSSLLRAGLLPRLRADAHRGLVVLLTPGPHPLEECAVRLATPAGTTAGALQADIAADPANLHRLVRQILAERPSGAEMFLVVDQFEEVFTLCRSEEERASFIAALVTAAQAPGSRCRVVLGVRADFYAHCTHYADLVGVLADAQVALGPMSAEQLRRAIVQPAVRAGLSVEGSLVVALVAECHGRPGVLPLLSHALLETWRRRRGNALTLAGYQAAGGLEGALTRTAETFYASLTPCRQRLARRLFLRLTALGEGTEDTKQPLPRTELDDSEDAAAVLEQAARARLLTLDDHHAEITHEALIRCWPRLHQWLTEDRESLRRHRRLSHAAALWESLDHDPDALYRGTRLALAREFAEEPAHRDALTARERAFLNASRLAEEARGHRALLSARRLRLLVACLAAVTLVATCAAGYALHAQRRVTQQRNEILSRTAVTEARTLRNTQPALYAQLMMAAYQLSPTTEARDGLLSAAGTSLPGRGRLVSAVAFDPAGRALAAGGEDSVQLWDLPAAGPPVKAGATPRTGPVASVAFAPDGRTLAVGGMDHRTRLWDISDRRHPVLTATLTAHTDVVFDVAFSPDGRTLATGSYDHTVRLWDLTASTSPTALAVLRGHRLNVKAVAFSRDGRTLATAGDDRTVRLWDVERPRRPVRLSVLTGHHDFVTSLAFSADGRTLVSGSDDRTIRIWDTHRPDHPTARSILADHAAVVISVALSRDGRRLASGGYDGTSRLWDLTDPGHPQPIGVITDAGGALNAVALSPDGQTLLTGSSDPFARLWPTDPHGAIAQACTRNPATITRAQWDRYFPDVRYNPPCGARS